MSGLVVLFPIFSILLLADPNLGKKHLKRKRVEVRVHRHNSPTNQMMWELGKHWDIPTQCTLGVCLCSQISMLNQFFVMMVVMSSSPVSMHSASIGVDCGTMSILRIIFSCIWLIFLCSFFVVFIVSPVC